jgi:hypothetical protein
MSLDELIFLGACSILARHRIFTELDIKDHATGDTQITTSVKMSKRVWQEVMDKRKEDADGNS